MMKRLAAYCIIGSLISAILFQLYSYLSLSPISIQPAERYQRDYSTLVVYVTILVLGTSLLLFSSWLQQYQYNKRKLLGVVTRSPTIPRWQRWLLSEWRLFGSTWSLSNVGKVAGLFLLNAIILYKDMENVVETADSSRNMYLQTLANRAAQLAVTNIAMSVVLSAKLSILQRYFFGMHTTLQWHKWFGRLGFLQVMYHGTYQIQFNYERQGGDIFATLTTNARHITGTLMLSAMFMLVLGSHPIVRLLSYRLFRWTHLSAFFMLVLVGCLHHWSFYLFYGAVLVFWVMDQIDRSFIAESCTVEALPGDIVRLKCQAPYQCGLLIPGQFAFISFGSTSWLKAWFHSHPFSICRMDPEVDFDESSLIGNFGKGGSFTFYIKSIGNETSTLYQLGQQHKKIHARISRPMGRPYITNAGTEFGDYDTIVLVAEGMGITPWLSVLHYVKEREHAIKTKSVYLIWSVRNIDTFYAFEHEFSQFIFTDVKLEIQLFVTGLSDPDEDYSVPSSIKLDIQNRPDYEEIMLKIQQERKEAVLGICTHEETMVRVNNIGLTYSWNMKKERFEL
ncbi:hypothetical protein BD770DRAFT_215119 [Pilaira anomala]|nr:hypothetical protein BD770DRAFT_215119 [Pilaira anomala]